MAGVEHDALVVQLRAAFLERSDERDQWLRRTLSGWADGYRAGFESGRTVGYGQAVTDWKVTVGTLVLDGPAYAEMDRRRYPPDGRLSWIILRPGDRCVHEAAGLLRCPDDCPGRQP